MQDTYKTCYLYDPATGELRGESIAQLSPVDLDQGREIYLMPDNATLDPPPAAVPGRAIGWDGEQWRTIPDYRGITYYDTITKEQHTLTSLSETPDPAWTDIAPPDPEDAWTGSAWVLPFAAAKARTIARIRQEADDTLRLIQSGYSQSEVISWTKQESGARDLADNLDAVTPDAEFVRSMAANRGIPVTDLVAKIMGNLSPYAETMARVLGNQQRREDLVQAASTLDELDAI